MGYSMALILILKDNDGYSNQLFFLGGGDNFLVPCYIFHLNVIRNIMKNNYHFLMLLNNWDAISGASFSTLVRAMGLITFLYICTPWIQRGNHFFSVPINIYSKVIGKGIK